MILGISPVVGLVAEKGNVVLYLRAVLVTPPRVAHSVSAVSEGVSSKVLVPVDVYFQGLVSECFALTFCAHLYCTLMLSLLYPFFWHLTIGVLLRISFVEQFGGRGFGRSSMFASLIDELGW